MANGIASHAGVALVSLLVGTGIGYYATHYEGSHTREDVTAQLAQIERDSSVLPIAGSPVKGAANASATIVIFTDFKAPATAKLYGDIIDHAFKVHGDHVAVVYKAYPLAQNPDAVLRAQAAAAAQLQNKFWPMANALNELADKPFEKANALALAQKLGINLEKFEKDFDSPEVREMIRKDIALGERLGVQGAPAVFINGQAVAMHEGVTQDVLMSALNAEIERMKQLTAQPGSNYLIASLLNQQAADSRRAVDVLGRPVRGAKDALVTIVEYSDYQCPFCARAEPTIAKVLESYDNVRVIFSHNPLPFHKDAKLAAQAAYAAGLQGKFWEMHELLFKNQTQLDELHLESYAREIGLNLEQFKADLKAPSTVAAIDKDLAEANTRGVSGTPNFLINGVTLSGAQSFEKFKEAIDSAIEKARPVQEKTGLTGEALYAEIMKTAPKPVPKLAPENVREFVDFSGAPMLGDANAPIVLIEFTDFECPFCSRANTTIHELMTKNPGKFKLIFKHNPLPFHKHADAAHRAAEAAAMQGKFWEMYDLLFANQKKLEQSDLENYASQIGLNLAKFKADMESDIVKKRIADDLKQGESVNVKGTPHFFMNGTRISGAQPIEKFQDTLDKEFALASKFMERGVSPDELYKRIVEEDKSALNERKNRRLAGRLDKHVLNMKRDNQPDKPVAISQGISYAKGPDNAPVVIYMFSEFQCPFCSRVEPTIAELEKIYGNKIKIVFKNFPLAFHKDAKLASEAALAAGEQGKFWEMHDVLFQNQKNLTRAALTEYAKQVGIDTAQFDAALDSHKFSSQVDLELKEGQDNGVTGTPTFFINGKKFVGAQSIEKFQAEIDEALK
ncbi:MAG: thioredoxin domain-containing protein [Proteobacteria bacterium]|nr:thioredoxin domain-containing protein [Pseudomonadota bacterium]